MFPICRNSSKIGFGKNGVCIGIYSVFKGCECRRGVTIYIYVYIHICIDPKLAVYTATLFEVMNVVLSGFPSLGSTDAYTPTNKLEP